MKGTGKINKRTAKVMKEPRCALPDTRIDDPYSYIRHFHYYKYCKTFVKIVVFNYHIHFVQWCSKHINVCMYQYQKTGDLITAIICIIFLQNVFLFKCWTQKQYHRLAHTHTESVVRLSLYILVADPRWRRSVLTWRATKYTKKISPLGLWWVHASNSTMTCCFLTKIYIHVYL